MVRPPRRMALGVPAYRGQIHGGHLEQLHNLIGACAMSQVSAQKQRHTDQLLIGHRPAFAFAGIIRIESCSIAKSRNLMLYGALKSNAIDWLLMCDADNYLVGDARVVTRMLADADHAGAAVVVAPVLRRDGVYNVVGEDERRGEGIEHTGMRSLAPEDFRGHILEVRRAGTAFMALHVDWFRANWPAQPWFRFEQIERDDGQPDEISEDHFLCDGVRQRGGKILCDGRFEPLHEGAPYHLVKAPAAAEATAPRAPSPAAVAAHG